MSSISCHRNEYRTVYILHLLEVLHRSPPTSFSMLCCRLAEEPPRRWSCCTQTATPLWTLQPQTSPAPCCPWLRPQRGAPTGTRQAHQSGTTPLSPPAFPLKRAACKSWPATLSLTWWFPHLPPSSLSACMSRCSRYILCCIYLRRT